MSFFIYILLTSLSFTFIRSWALLPHQHPDPESIVLQLQRKLNASLTSRLLLETNPIFSQSKDQTPCQTGNPVDDCWRCDPNWANDRQRLADCAIGFGQGAKGGKGGKFYIVNNPSDEDPINPPPGTLRHAVIQTEPLWIIFANDMHINLKTKLVISSSKTIDGRGAIVHVTGKGCLEIKNVGNIIIHGLFVHDCVPSEAGRIRVSPTDVMKKGKSEGDGITIKGVRNLWIDHCSFARCTDGLVDVTEGSTAVTVTNSYFTDHVKVMLLGHSDHYTGDSGMQVTVAFNHFGKGLVERMPRCRHGYFHVVNNDYTEWQLYAIGGSAAPTINSQGNRFVAQSDRKEVTKRMAKVDEWKGWNWRSEGDLMVNGAFFVPSGAGVALQYQRASSIPAMSASLINQLTMHSGVLVGPPSNGGETPYTPPGGGAPVINPPDDGNGGENPITPPGGDPPVINPPDDGNGGENPITPPGGGPPVINPPDDGNGDENPTIPPGSGPPVINPPDDGNGDENPTIPPGSGPPVINPPDDGQTGSGNPNIPPGTIQPPNDGGYGYPPPPNGGGYGYGYPPGATQPGGNPYRPGPPSCFPPGNTPGGGDPRMVYGPGSPQPPPPGVLQGSGHGEIPYCGGPRGRRASSGPRSIQTMAHSSVPITIFLSSLVVLVFIN